MRYLLLLFIFPCFASVTLAQGTTVSQQDSILGNWSVLDNQMAISIVERNGVFEGRVIWLAEPNDKNGLPKLDVNNIEKSKRSQPLLHMVCLYGFEYNATANTWNKGYFYNPFTGDTIKATLKLNDSNSIEMSGYAGFTLDFETENWVRF